MARVAQWRLTADGVAAIHRKLKEGRWASITAFCRDARVARSTYNELVGLSVLFEKETIQGKLTLFGITDQAGLYEYVEHETDQLHPRNEIPNNLPTQPTSFIGRDLEKATVKRLLASATMLTLTGAGGCGKTRLALQVASELLYDYPDGVWLVELAALSEPDLAPRAIMSTLGLREDVNRPNTETAADYLKSKILLLILDNCEHLVVACAQLAAELIRECPEVKILATSREACRVDGETIWRVPSMLLPELVSMHAPEGDLVSTVARSDAIRLFVERARSVRPDFALTNQNAPCIVGICRHLDGIPLAIELAAARVRSMAVEDIRFRLDGRFKLLTNDNAMALPRHQTLTALIAWSYDLLDNHEQAILARLSTFSAGWNVDAAEQICHGDGISLEEVCAGLTSLVDKSLVVFDEHEKRGRYRLLETVRQFAEARLNESGEAVALRQKHCDFFRSLAVDAEVKLRGAEEIEWLDLLDSDQDNLRSALNWSLRNEKEMEPADNQRPSPNAQRLASTGLLFCNGLIGFWLRRGHLAEGRSYCSKALAAEGAEEPTTARAKTLLGMGILARNQSDFVYAVRCFEQGLDIFRGLGDLSGIAATLGNLGLVASTHGDYDAAQAYYEECLAIRRVTGDELNIAVALNNLGGLACQRGDYESARVYINECLAIWRATQHPWGIPAALYGLGQIAFDQCDYKAAQEYQEESLTGFHKIGDKQSIAATLEAYAGTMVAQGCPEPAARLWGAAELLREQIGSPLPPHERGKYARNVSRARAALDDKAFSAAWEAGRAMSLENVVELALERSNE